MKKKKVFIIAGVVLVLVILFVFFKGNEDTWIRDEKGVWVKHGEPSETPDYVEYQQIAIKAAGTLYDVRGLTMDFDSQCLGIISSAELKYAVDIVHVPRIAEDDLEKNQCASYLSGEVKNFIELDKEGNVVRVSD